VQAPNAVGSDQLTVALPAGTKCTGGASKNKCVVEFVSTAGFGNCVVVQQGAAGAAAPAAAAAAKPAAAAAAKPAAAAAAGGKKHKGGKKAKAAAAAAAVAAAKPKGRSMVRRRLADME
jgi:hypothetical protein